MNVIFVLFLCCFVSSSILGQNDLVAHQRMEEWNANASSINEEKKDRTITIGLFALAQKNISGIPAFKDAINTTASMSIGGGLSLGKEINSAFSVEFGIYYSFKNYKHGISLDKERYDIALNYSYSEKITIIELEPSVNFLFAPWSKNTFLSNLSFDFGVSGYKSSLGTRITNFNILDADFFETKNVLNMAIDGNGTVAFFANFGLRYEVLRFSNGKFLEIILRSKFNFSNEDVINGRYELINPDSTIETFEFGNLGNRIGLALSFYL